MKRIIKPLILLSFILIALFIGRSYEITQESIRNLISEAGIYGPLLFIGIYILFTIFFVPGTPLSIVGGLFFGSIKGTLYIVIGATIGAYLAFLFSRYFVQNYVTKLLHKVKGIEKYNDKLESNGLITTLFFRLVPIFPFNALNFALGLTKV